jgi:hypothetical protein
MRRAALAAPGTPRRPPRPTRRTHALDPEEAGRGPRPADLAAVADQLDELIASGEPQKAKALLRLLIQELRVDGRAQIQPTYRLVTREVCATSEKVERTGIEPVTSGLQSERNESTLVAVSRGNP